MTWNSARVLCAGLVVMSCAAARANAQAAADTVGAHLALAKAAAQQDYAYVLNALCSEPAPPAAQPAAAAATPPGPPPASEWHAEPAKVFDNLYFVGSKSVSAWAITTSEGLILIDSTHEYSVEDEIVNGLKKLGLDPAKIKYVVVTHAHGDHFAGSKYLQDHFGPHIVLSAADWDFMQGVNSPAKPRRDLVATDGGKLTLGDTTLTTYVTPGHTPGTISLLIPVKDGGQQHLAAMWGGMTFNFQKTPEAFRIYANSARRFYDIVANSPADVVLTNHPSHDKTLDKIASLKMRQPGGPHPFIVGNDGMKRLLQLVGECAQVNILRLSGSARP